MLTPWKPERAWSHASLLGLKLGQRRFGRAQTFPCFGSGLAQRQPAGGEPGPAPPSLQLEAVQSGPGRAAAPSRSPSLARLGKGGETEAQGAPSGCAKLPQQSARRVPALGV